MEENQNISEIISLYFPQFKEIDLIEEIKDVGRLMKVEEGEILIDIDERITHLPLLYRGAIKVHREDPDGNEILLYYLEPGNTCASSLTCCMDKKISTIRAEAEEDTYYISVPIDCIDKWMIRYTSWKDFIMSTYANRFEELLLTVDELAFKRLDDRLIHYLEDKAKITGNNMLSVSHREIAYDLNSSREVVSRLLKQLEIMGEIELGRGKIELLQ